MKIKQSLFLLLLSIIGSSVFAQTQRNIELEKIVSRDVQNFKLSNTDLKLYRKEKSGRSSDYFKPKAENIADTTLLRDSSYVKMYRNLAYSKNSARKSTGEYLMIAAAAAVAAAIAVVITI